MQKPKLALWYNKIHVFWFNGREIKKDSLNGFQWRSICVQHPECINCFVYSVFLDFTVGAELEIIG